MRFYKRHITFLALLLLAAMISACSAEPQQTSELKELDNAQMESILDQEQGKPVMVVFWATWCPPCVSEIPTLNKLREKYSADELAIISVSVDQTAEDLEKFLAKNELKYTVLHDKSDVAVSHGVTAIPHMEFYDASGNRVLAKTGAFPFEMLDNIVQKLVGKTEK